MGSIDFLLRDAHYGARDLLESPAFSLAAVLILGLGIGANTVMFSVVNAVVVRPLAFPDANRLPRVWLGVGSALAPGRLIATMVFGVEPHDLPTLTAVVAIMMFVGVIAGLAPAYRATRIDPLIAVRDE
jgi:ABC-type antimicrobial peptide transport system permease subunit